MLILKVTCVVASWFGIISAIVAGESDHPFVVKYPTKAYDKYVDEYRSLLLNARANWIEKSQGTLSDLKKRVHREKDSEEKKKIRGEIASEEKRLRWLIKNEPAYDPLNIPLKLHGMQQGEMGRPLKIVAIVLNTVGEDDVVLGLCAYERFAPEAIEIVTEKYLTPETKRKLLQGAAKDMGLETVVFCRWPGKGKELSENQVILDWSDKLSEYEYVSVGGRSKYLGSDILSVEVVDSSQFLRESQD